MNGPRGSRSTHACPGMATGRHGSDILSTQKPVCVCAACPGLGQEELEPLSLVHSQRTAIEQPACSGRMMRQYAQAPQSLGRAPEGTPCAAASKRVCGCLMVLPSAHTHSVSHACGCLQKIVKHGLAKRFAGASSVRLFSRAPPPVHTGAQNCKSGIAQAGAKHTRAARGL